MNIEFLPTGDGSEIYNIVEDGRIVGFIKNNSDGTAFPWHIEFYYHETLKCAAEGAAKCLDDAKRMANDLMARKLTVDRFEDDILNSNVIYTSES